MSRALSVRTVETVKPNSARQEIPDRHLPSLYLIVKLSGGRTRKHTIGSEFEIGIFRRVVDRNLGHAVGELEWA